MATLSLSSEVTFVPVEKVRENGLWGVRHLGYCYFDAAWRDKPGLDGRFHRMV